MASPDQASVEIIRPRDDTVTVRLTGDWRLHRGLPRWSDFEKEFPADAAPIRARIEDAGVADWDTGLTAFLLEAAEFLNQHNIAVDLGGLPEGARRLVELALSVPDKRDAQRQTQTWNLGGALMGAWSRMVDGWLTTLEFLGQVTLALLRMVTGRARMRLRDLWLVMQQCGADALPIVLLINVLVGMILAFVGVVQLAKFGAAIFVADLVALAMLREMAGLMTGIILAGRTGAAFAAQLGTMQANEEIDAFRSFAIPPMDFLVLPRVVALVLMMPLLTVFADLVGILGGLIVSTTMMDISLRAYWTETVAAASVTHFLLGVGKSFVFGALVAFCGCYQGIRCGRNAQAVGIATTRAVVSGITALIVADALFAVLANKLHI
jgi:phospholipid/cholesterol/gamma-HCH transport system permease protein